MSNNDTVFNEVSPESLKRWPPFTFLIAGIVVQIVELMFGASLFWMTDFKNFILSILIADVILFFLFSLSGNVGRVKRIPTVTLYGNIFGRLGTRIITVFLLPAGIIWISWMTEIASDSFLAVFPRAKLVIVVFSIIIISVMSSIKGIKGMEFSSYIQIPVVLSLMLAGCTGIFKSSTFNFAVNSENSLNLFQGVVFVVLTWITFIPFYPDYTRFIKTKKDMYLSTFIAFGLLNTFMMICGGIFASFCGKNFDLVKVFKEAGIPGLLALIIIVLCTWTFNDRSLYSFGISVNVILGDKRFVGLLLALGGAAAGIMTCTGIQDKLVAVLDYLGAVYAPLLSIFLCEYYILGGMKSGFSNFDKMPYFKARAFIPWAGGVILNLLVKSYQPALSMIVSFILYFAIEAICRRRTADSINNNISTM